MTARLDDAALDRLFRSARTYNGFRPDPVDDDTVHALYDLVKWGPTAFNSQPSRYVFVRSAVAKARLAPALSSSNRGKTVNAPLNVILAYDALFFEHLPGLTASPAAKEMFEENPGLVEPTLLRNAGLQAGYLVLAARALGLDVGLMTGFKAELVNQEFFPDGRYRVNIIANLGYGDDASLRPRARRFAFEEVAQII
jgi:nitroreductase